MTLELDLSLLLPGTTWRNWARSEIARPEFIATPARVDDVAVIVRLARERGLSVKTVGSSYSFTGIAVAPGIQLDVSGLRGIMKVDRQLRQVTIGAGTRLNELGRALEPYGLALENLGYPDRQTVAGATTTGTHGTGATFGGLSTQIVAMTIVTADASILHISETENSELFPAARVGLGALGVIVDLTIQCVPAFLLSVVEKPAGFNEVLDDFEERVTSVDHFEFYWRVHTDGVITKTSTRLPADLGRHPASPMVRWVEDQVRCNNVLALVCSVGRLIPSAAPTLNRFAIKAHRNSSYSNESNRVFGCPRTTRFREMEYGIARAAIPDALRDIRSLIERRGWKVSYPIEVRVAAADSNWMSTAFGRDSGYIAVYRHSRDDPHEYFRAVEQVLAGYGGRPHWGKMHYQSSESLAELFPRYGDFVAVRDRLDPTRVFTNHYLDRVLGS